jgi:hypothetical protein
MTLHTAFSINIYDGNTTTTKQTQGKVILIFVIQTPTFKNTNPLILAASLFLSFFLHCQYLADFHLEYYY